jgi:hypothetical protein
MHRNQDEGVTLGITLDGIAFNYPNLPERHCGMLAQQLDCNRLSYAGDRLSIRIDGRPAVVWSAELEKADPLAYQFVSQFVEENRLKVRSRRTAGQLSATLKYHALNVDRRDLCECRVS